MVRVRIRIHNTEYKDADRSGGCGTPGFMNRIPSICALLCLDRRDVHGAAVGRHLVPGRGDSQAGEPGH